MVLHVPISSEAEAKLKRKADAVGIDLATFAARTLERAAEQLSLDDVFAPVREEFERSGITEDELTAMLEEAKHDARTQRRERQ